MIRAGASPKRAFQAINGGKSLESRILLGRILSRAERLFEGRLIVSCETGEDIQCCGQASRDSDTLYQLLQSVAGVEAIIIIREESPSKCTVGLRSRDRIDVAAIAAAFGGGGHRNAAGVSIEGTITNVREKLVNEFDKYFISK
jgi:phosphoesterase RecJ-like protein